ncbi:Arginyl-tRNA synthetase [[Actinomadura] parvosata subsp. kistnae]|uniref:Arginine--tRNA ligase n=1 Tax=[Actinomadura] parvosata subsp. kistnae TaxID=1909395 RepID=A0A1V0ADM0_9ACTN|nr:arginine--tRNA ligase [Nonomuraea sp. ATCC 55076]AQZ68321.1 arginine--tRNA ligase [Nonomuraea sp. ATCC 55076]SPL93252.1 Arginyl-tRNA synthetase [Actinomadura parvosata subsp. kistnae]
MTDPQIVLTERVQQALARAFGPEHADADPLIRPSQFADFQANVAMSLAKRLRRSPREVAEAITAELADFPGTVEVSGPGFLNITLSDAWVESEARQMLADPRLGVGTVTPAQTVVIDYSAPNAAKEMHVGHLRTTIVGDSLARLHEHLGNKVIRQNHLGDWGTPFGMLIEHLLDIGEPAAVAQLEAGQGTEFYQAARAKFDGDEAFKTRARARVSTLQSGDPDTLRLWHVFMDATVRFFNKVYDVLGVTLTDADIAGESMYNPMLQKTCDDLEASGTAVLSEGALCVFPPGFTGSDDKPLPLIIRKSDGGYGYATTDMAAIRYRVHDLKADRILYVVGNEQALHFQMVFAAAKEAGWLPDTVQAEHVRIGMMLGKDGRRFKTRSGESVKLMDLLQEAIDRAAKLIEDRGYDEATQREIAHAVGMAAVKYADLSVSHDSEYVFDLDRMVATTGNTGPYMQYATARIRSIFRRAGISPADATAPIVLAAPAERALGLHLLGFGELVAQVTAASEPHRLCAFLFQTASLLSTFYEECPVIKEGVDPQTRDQRLALCALTLRVLETGLDLLGVPVPERM